MELRLGNLRVLAGPVYDFHDWRLVEQSANRLVYRPSGWTMLKRCWVPVGVLIGGAFIWLLGLNMLQQTTGLAPPSVFKVLLAALMLALLWPLSGLWNLVVFERTGQGFSVGTRWLFPRSRVLLANNFTRVVYGRQEYIFRNKRGGLTDHYWAWYARLEGRDGALQDSPRLVTFFPLRERFISNLQQRPPERVAQFLNWLYLNTNLPVEGPQIVEAPLLGTRGRLGKTVMLDQKTTTHTFDSLEQVPERFRSLAAQMMEEAQQEVNQSSAQFRFLDSGGEQQTYTSLEEMPPEVREIFESMQGEHGKD